MLIQGKYLLIAIMIILTSAIAISTRILILQYFHPPVINIDPEFNQIIGYIIRFATVIGAIVIYLCSREYWEHTRPVYRIILFAILMMALTEQLFRFPIMAMVVDVPWPYQVLAIIPSYLEYILLSLLISLFLNIVYKTNQFKIFKYIVFAILVTTLISYLQKIAQNALMPLLVYVSQFQISKPIHPPYGMNIMIPEYITFIEPTIATFIMFYLIKDTLSMFSTLAKGLIIGAILIITIHGGSYSIVPILSSQGNIFYRVFYYGQFLWEYLALGILTVYSFAFLEKNRSNPFVDNEQ